MGSSCFGLIHEFFNISPNPRFPLSFYVFNFRDDYHGGEARDLKLEIPGTPPYGKDMYFFDFFINNGRICMGFFADNLKKNVQKPHI